MAALALEMIDIGGPCKLSDNGVILYFDEGVRVTPEPVWRSTGTSVGGSHDDVLVDLVYKIAGRPKSVWTAAYRGALIPDAYVNWSTSGARLCGTANRAVSIIGSNAHGFDFTRCCLTKMATVYGGLGKPLWGEAEWTAFIGNGKALNAADAFMVENTTAWSQLDYPTTHQETLCTGTWGAVAGWDSVIAEEGFNLSHELKVNPVKSGNITVDQKVESYRAMLSYLPQQPTTAQLLSALGLQGAGAGIGTRRSANAQDFIVAGVGLSITGKSMGLNKGSFVFDNKLNRHGEFGMITAQSAPGTRLVFA